MFSALSFLCSTFGFDLERGAKMARITWFGVGARFVLSCGILFLGGCCGVCRNYSQTTMMEDAKNQRIPEYRPIFSGSKYTPLQSSIEYIRAEEAKNAKEGGYRPRDPITGMLIYKALSDALNKLQNLLDNAAGDIQAVGNSLEANGHALLSDMDTRYKDMLDRTLDQLHTEERATWNAAVALTDRADSAAQALQAQLFDNAKVAMWEGDIVAYDAVKAIPCQPEIARVVYASSLNESRPLSLRLGADLPTIKVRGNFLSFEKVPVFVDGTQVEVRIANANEYVVDIPKNVQDKINSTGPQLVDVYASPKSCNPTFLGCEVKDGPKQSVGILVKPSVSADFSVVVRPVGEVPTKLKWPIDYYRSDENCDAHYRVDTPQSLADDPALSLVSEPKPWEIYTTTANCGSGIEEPRVTGNRSVLVPGHLDGCGYGWPFHDCRGRGWLGYHLDLHYNGFVQQALNEQTFQQNSVSHGDFDFAYTEPVPSGTRYIHWNYVVTIKLHEGGQTRTVTLTNDVSNSDGIVTNFDASAKRLHVKIPQPRVQKM